MRCRPLIPKTFTTRRFRWPASDVVGTGSPRRGVPASSTISRTPCCTHCATTTRTSPSTRRRGDDITIHDLAGNGRRRRRLRRKHHLGRRQTRWHTRKPLDVSRLLALGWKPLIDLRHGNRLDLPVVPGEPHVKRRTTRGSPLRAGPAPVMCAKTQPAGHFPLWNRKLLGVDRPMPRPVGPP